MKKGFKKLFFRVFFVAILLSLTFSVKALTIKETTNPNDSYDDLVDGTIVIGITKFEPGVVITALRASQAAFDDVMFQFYEIEEPKSVEIYYLLMGKWYNIDENNKATLVVDEEIKTKLNSNDIYYVNNVEKSFKIPYSRELEDGYEFVLYVEEDFKITHSGLTYENGNINVPVSVPYFVVHLRNIEKNTTKLIDLFEKEDFPDPTITQPYSSLGKIEGNQIGEETYTRVGDTLTVDGSLKWFRETLETEEGNYASIKITAPDLYLDFYNSYYLNNNTKIIIDNGPEMNWSDEAEDTYFVRNLKFDSETNSHTITIKWVDGNTQVFTINLADTAKLELSGTIEKGDATGGDLTYNVTGNDQISISGGIDWSITDSVRDGYPAGNYASVKIKANPAYTEEFLLANTNVTIDSEPSINWATATYSEEEDVYFIYYPRFDEDTSSHTVTIEWEEGNTQVFTINLDSATLKEPPKGTIVKGDSTGGDLTYSFNGDIATINGEMEWYIRDASVGRMLAGNYASVKISANEIYTEEFLNNNATITIDSRPSLDWDVATDPTLGEGQFFIYYPRFDENTFSHTVTVKWEEGNTQVFTIILGNEATLKPAPKGEIEGNQIGEETYITTEDTVTVYGTISWYEENVLYEGSLAGYYASAKITAPDVLGEEYLNANTKIIIDENPEMNWSDEAVGKVFTHYQILGDGTFSILVQDITIKWSEGHTQTFSIKLDSDVVYG